MSRSRSAIIAEADSPDQVDVRSFRTGTPDELIRLRGLVVTDGPALAMGRSMIVDLDVAAARQLLTDLSALLGEQS